MKTICRSSFFPLFFIVSIAFTACNPTTDPKLLPVLTTTEVSVIRSTTATSGGNITSDGGSSVIARGVCWSTKASPTIADNKTDDGGGIGSFTSSITGLTAGTTYFVRAYATTSAGTGYGSAYQITTLVANLTVTDIDVNVYKTVTIGTQIWMAENLKTTKYNDGTAIPVVTGSNVWPALTTGAYCWYNNDPATNKSTYGALYNWYAVNTAKLAPAGWHVATDAEWAILESYVSANLGTSSSVAKALAATTNWESYLNIDAIGNNLTLNNSSCFTALPGGYRDTIGSFVRVRYSCFWWSFTEFINVSGSNSYGWFMSLSFDNSSTYRNYNTKSNGYSVRCVRN